ncbi:MAG: cobaltochelatase subunit CobN [Bacteroidales bacterium]|nr:cobaltochelatase subunit CobN [Bacteroidales bacterium]
MEKRRKAFVWALVSVLLLAALLLLWNRCLRPTRIAFVNYQVTTLGQIAKSNDSRFIRLKEVDLENLKALRHCDMVMLNGMGLRITEEQRALLQRISRRVPMLSTAVTNPDNDIVSVDSLTADTLTQYLSQRGRGNYRSMLRYIRRQVDRKPFFAGEPEPVRIASRELLYHADPAHPEAEEAGFSSLAGYLDFLKQKGLYREGAPNIILTGQMGEPFALIESLEASGNNLFPVRNMRAFVRDGHADSLQVSAVINMAHGRMGDYMVRYLERHNIPLFNTVYVPQLTSAWEADRMGMSGGFLSQSIVTPEIDGAIRPYAIFAHRVNAEGLTEMYAEPHRLADFVETVNRYIALKSKPNRDKRIAIFYYKGPGQNALTASGLEVVPSLYRLLLALRDEGYQTGTLPASAEALGRMLQQQGSVLGSYAEGAFERFLREGNPEMLTQSQYLAWVKQALRAERYAEVVSLYGDFPGRYMSAEGKLAVARLQFGNVVLMPQPMAGQGGNTFKIVHGTESAPPHTYIAAYLWARYGFQADALIHFGTHGSLEFTPRKQAALCDNDWPDRLIGTTPHFYLYTIGNVGEGLIAKRRSYATLLSYLTPPFMESGVRGTCRQLTEAVKTYYHALEQGGDADAASLAVKRLAVKLGLHRSLELDSSMKRPYTEAEISRIENFAEEISNEKMAGRPYILGEPYPVRQIESSVKAMTTDPIAYSLLALDRQRGRTTLDADRSRAQFTQQYLNPARQLVEKLLQNPQNDYDAIVCQAAGVSREELAKARETVLAQAPMDMMSVMLSMADEAPSMQGGAAGKGTAAQRTMMQRMGKRMKPEKALKMAKMMGASPEALKKMEESMQGQPAMAEDTTGKAAKEKAAALEKKELQWATAVADLDKNIQNVYRYRQLLQQSPAMEIKSLMNALAGGFTAPSPGGDPIANPNTLPTGRNLYGINAENTPSESAWEKGKMLAEKSLSLYRQRHHDSLPRKVSYTLWSGEFIETEGATIAQVLYMLGVEPLRDAFGRVTDLRLIPSRELGRPRIDVVVQTSGQLRDIAASRLFLINRAVEMAAAAGNDTFANRVAEGVVEAERILVDKGLSPKEAREMALFRVFGGVNGGYGTGIQSMVQAGDRWEEESEIAETYLNNMGAFYGDEAHWETMRQYAFEAALSNTDAVIQPRQSNTWGALSLDHVYEFMGGMNLAVRHVTGKDPDAYLSDYRNHHHMRMQEVKEAIGVESRSTLFNPNYIGEMMKGGASAANTFSELLQNSYGWNVMKPQAIGSEMWDEIYQVYVKDKYQLGLRGYFERENAAALQEMTAVMLETARKGMWKASEEQLETVARLHTELVRDHGAACSGMVCDNAMLRQFIARQLDAQTAEQYKQQVEQVRQRTKRSDGQQEMVLKKEELQQASSSRHLLNNSFVAAGVLAALLLLVWVVRRRRKNNGEED